MTKICLLSLALFSSAPAFAGELNLLCTGDTLIYSVQSMRLTDETIEISYRYGHGLELHVDKGLRQNAWFSTSYGVQVSIPGELLDGSARAAMPVSLSTYDYPYETVLCRLN